MMKTFNFGKIQSMILIALMLSMVATSVSMLSTVRATDSGQISLTFDDGIYSQYSTVFPLLVQYNMPGTFYIPTGAGPLGAIAPDGLPYNKINQIPISGLLQMQDAGMEIGSHSVTHNNFCDMTTAQMQYEASQSLETLQSWGLTVTDFAYPYGTGDLSVANAVMAQYYDSARSTIWNNEIGTVSLPTTAFELMSYNAEYQVGNGLYSQLLPTAESYVNYAVNNNQWIIFLIHNVVGNADTNPVADEQNAEANGGITYSDFVALLNYIQYEEQCNGLQVLTVHQAMTYDLSGVPTPAPTDSPVPTVNPTPTATADPTPVPTIAPTPTDTPTPIISPPITTPLPIQNTMTAQDWTNFYAWLGQQPHPHAKTQSAWQAYLDRMLNKWKAINGFS